MKYNEDEFLNDVIDYIKTTYNQHYVSGSDKDVQLLDLWAARGTALETSINTAMKYILRYGKKNGYNKIDLFKAIHYITFAAFFTPKEEKFEPLKIEEVDNHPCDNIPNGLPTTEGQVKDYHTTLIDGAAELLSKKPMEHSLLRTPLELKARQHVIIENAIQGFSPPCWCGATHQYDKEGVNYTGYQDSRVDAITEKKVERIVEEEVINTGCERKMTPQEKVDYVIRNGRQLVDYVIRNGRQFQDGDL